MGRHHERPGVLGNTALLVTCICGLRERGVSCLSMLLNLTIEVDWTEPRRDIRCVYGTHIYRL
jgi:hypothetical protein